ncbi:MAG: hypothetical protein U0174_06740 [Polyangiaceae bacterium]
METKTMKIVYTVVEREAGKEKKSFWVRIGVGYVNSDGSLNLKLDAMPVNGSLQVRDYEPKDAERGERPSRGHYRDEREPRGALA